MNRLRVLVDIDGVLRDFHRSVSITYRDTFGAWVDPETIKTWEMHPYYPFHSESSDIFWSWIDNNAQHIMGKAPLCPGADKFLSDLLRKGCETILYTTQKTPNTLYATVHWVVHTYWLHRYIGGLAIATNGGKKDFVEGDVMIDDYPKNLLDAGDQVAHKFLVARPWNADWDSEPHGVDIPRLTLEEIWKRIERL